LPALLPRTRTLLTARRRWRNRLPLRRRASGRAHYNYFRDYDPAVGRYVESDPIGLRGGRNTYAYVMNQPLRYVDPMGLKARVCCRKIPWLPAAHCFVQEEKDDDDYKNCDGECQSKKRTLGLQGPAPFGDSDNGGGKKFQDHGFDDPSESKCGEWTSYCDLSQCLDQAYASYADPSIYSGPRGPNSNTFASRLMAQCKLKPPARGWPKPGWGQPPAGPLPPRDK
jgi:RHS repeat-associated protein